MYAAICPCFRCAPFGVVEVAVRVGCGMWLCFSANFASYSDSGVDVEFGIGFAGLPANWTPHAASLGMCVRIMWLSGCRWRHEGPKIGGGVSR